MTSAVQRKQSKLGNQCVVPLLPDPGKAMHVAKRDWPLASKEWRG
jgi:hypothetical protein